MLFEYILGIYYIVTNTEKTSNAESLVCNFILMIIKILTIQTPGTILQVAVVLIWQ